MMLDWLIENNVKMSFRKGNDCYVYDLEMDGMKYSASVDPESLRFLGPAIAIMRGAQVKIGVLDTRSSVAIMQDAQAEINGSDYGIFPAKIGESNVRKS